MAIHTYSVQTYPNAFDTSGLCNWLENNFSQLTVSNMAGDGAKVVFKNRPGYLLIGPSSDVRYPGIKFTYYDENETSYVTAVGSNYMGSCSLLIYDLQNDGLLFGQEGTSSTHSGQFAFIDSVNEENVFKNDNNQLYIEFVNDNTREIKLVGAIGAGVPAYVNTVTSYALQFTNMYVESASLREFLAGIYIETVGKLNASTSNETVSLAKLGNKYFYVWYPCAVSNSPNSAPLAFECTDKVS